MSDTAVLVVDMLNSHQHPDAEVLVPNVEKFIEPLADLAGSAQESDDIDLLYVYDKYGQLPRFHRPVLRHRPPCPRWRTA